MKILLVCSAGMSTSMLVESMREAAKSNNQTVQIDAIAIAELSLHLEELHVVLIGPQVRYLEAQVRSNVAPQGVKVAIIDQIAYGMMDGERVLKQAMALHKVEVG